ncbi:hypothetical protein JR064_04865 [Xanthomonas sp. CFBP 8703]|uniref:Uncharacterized protein n=1 Tax=Xanthomonas bonasiae TaxID=2810351 RepID=A0ABS3AZH2_9XANT|nr:hypothetical protein [Xanthomonas bonasiae]MBN6101490.1 hypothetical protein [Xanthomonas bonasiae]
MEEDLGEALVCLNDPQLAAATVSQSRRIEVTPLVAQVLAAAEDAKELVGGVRDLAAAGLPVLDGAHADAQQLSALDVGQAEDARVAGWADP